MSDSENDPSADANMRESSVEIPLEPSLVAQMREIEKHESFEPPVIQTKSCEPEPAKLTAE